MEEKRPKIGVGVIIKKNGKILLGKRKGSHGSGCWSFPGGHLEFFESLEDCVKRETKEETGLTVSDIQFLTITNDFFRKEEKHYITIIMEAQAEGEPKIMEPEKCEKWCYFNPDELPDPLFIPVKNLIEKNLNLIK